MIKNDKLKDTFFNIALIISILILFMVFFILFLISADFFVDKINNVTIISGIISGTGSFFGGIIGAIVALLILNKKFKNMKQLKKDKDNALIKRCALILRNDLKMMRANITSKPGPDILLENIDFQSWDKIRYKIADLLDMSDFKKCEGLYFAIREGEEVSKKNTLQAIETLIKSFNEVI